MKGFAKMIWEFAEALKKHGNDGFKHVTVTDYTIRMQTCVNCEHFTKTQSCGLCGCHMPVKARWRTTQCADNPPKWLATNGSKREEGANTDPSD
tara:strand:+ start:147 stop:428 length:282 start_codon:yes stop_codon:yes gene_type:complete